MALWLARDSRQTRIDEDGTVIWNQVPGAFINYAVAVSGAEKSVFAAARSSSTTHWARDADGDSLWTGDHGVVLYAAAFDPSGNIYVAGDDNTDGIHYRKLDGDGNSIYTIAGSAICGALSARGSTYMYVGVGNYVYQRNATSTSWSPNWSYNHGAPITALTEDTDGNIYVGAERASNLSVRKLNASGTVQWSFDTGGNVRAIALDEANGVLYAVGARVSSSKTAWKINAATGAEVTTGWPTDHGGTLRAVAVDVDGNVYVGGFAVSTVTVRKYQADGTEITAGDWPLTLGGTCYGMAYLAPSQATPPGLALPIAMGLPICTYSHQANSGLALSISLALPAVSSPPVPPAPDPTLRTLYRVYLSEVGGSELLELPMAALECTRRLGESTWISVIVPSAAESWINAIAARAGGEVVIYSGVATVSGETLGEFLRATLTETVVSRDARAGTITLTARVIPTTFTAGSYTLTDVTERGADDGRHTVACAVDPRIRPNDTVDDGLTSWTTGIITYRIDPVAAAMRITEAL